jgi:hypothetical protein
MKKTLLSLLIAAGGSLSATPVFFMVTVDTGITPGTLGNLDFQLNPASGASPALTAAIALFSPTAGLNNPAPTGDVTGDLTTQLAINNSTNFNDYFVGYTYPAQIVFRLELSGPAIDSPAGSGDGSTFFFSLYDSTGNTPLQTTDSAVGSLFSLDILNTGATALHDNSTNGASVSLTPVTVTPEPGSFILMGVGCIAAVLLRRRMR